MLKDVFQLCYRIVLQLLISFIQGSSLRISLFSLLRDWCLTMRCVLDARDSLINLLSTTEALGGLPSIEALFIQRIVEIQEILPQKIEEAILQCSYVYDTMLMDSVFREVGYSF